MTINTTLWYYQGRAFRKSVTFQESHPSMLGQTFPGAEVARSRFFHGWVIVAACALMIAITYGLMYSYSVFFKPLADYFSWGREAVSLIYSASLIIRGAISIGVGWLADRYGAGKLMIICGIMIGLGLVLSSQVQTLWQFFVTYALIEAFGLSGAFGIGTAVVSRWFTHKRGLALGIVSSGSGLGTLLIVPGSERLIEAFGWSQAFIISGVIAGVLVIIAASLLRPPPPSMSPASPHPVSTADVSDKATGPPRDVTLGRAIRDARMLFLAVATLTFFFGIQMVAAHLVNYAIDTGISPLVAATFMSVIGAVSIAGRLTSGAAADKVGIINTMVLTRLFLALALACLIFTRSLWAFYLFAVIFGLPYGGEIPQIPMFVGRYFGTKAMAALGGLTMFITSIGGALGPWAAGRIFDASRSYQGAFIAGASVALVSLILALVMKRQSWAKD
jgi:MFS family permease